MRAVLRLPDVRLLFVGLSTGMVGDSLMGGQGHRRPGPVGHRRRAQHPGTATYRRTPGHLVGRVSMAAETLTSGPQTISIAGGAILVSAVSYRLLLTIVLTGMLIGADYLWLGRRQTHPQRQAEPPTLVTSTANSNPKHGEAL
jgi:hypothetical protein